MIKKVLILLIISISAIGQEKGVVVGAARMDQYLHRINKNELKIGVVCNQTSRVGDVHLVDTLVSLGVKVRKIFSPEHGFRGKFDAGESVESDRDSATGVEIVSLYGDHNRPTLKDMAGIDYMVFDIQDVGVRFYTYISTLQYVLEACADRSIPIIILDRPNPNAHYVDGPVLESSCKSFIGLQEIPIVYGMTIAEYAKMLIHEKWLENAASPKYIIVSCENYSHSTPYLLPVPPSPNLHSDIAIAWYPTLCLFEGTNVSVGRGTERPFEFYGSPYFMKDKYTFLFQPNPNEGAKNPLFKGMLCAGEDLHSVPTPNKLELSYILNAYKNWDKSHSKSFFLTNNFFEKLAGNKVLKSQIEKGMSEESIRETWKLMLHEFKIKRKNYLLYPDF